MPFRLFLAMAGVVAAALASCSGSRPRGRPAANAISSAERTEARADRAARRQARAEQPVIAVRHEPPPPAPKPPPPPAASASAAPTASATATASASATPVASASVPASAPPPDFCEQLCRRSTECLFEHIGRNKRAGSAMQDLLRQQMGPMEKKCRDACETLRADKLERARQCLREKNCEDFLDCTRRSKRD